MVLVAVALQLVDEQTLDASPAQLEGEPEPDRPAADDENWSFDLH